MAVKARKVLRLEYEQKASFDLDEDRELTMLLNPWRMLDPYGCGIACFLIDTLEWALDHAKEERTKALLRGMIKDAEAEGFIEFYCS